MDSGKQALISSAEKEKVFVFQKRAYLKDTNAEGNVYFSRYFEWQGEAREDFFRQAVPDHKEILKTGTKLITVHSWIKNEKESYVFDEILVKIQTTSLKRMSMELSFAFINKNTGQIVAIGGQKLAFADREGHLVVIPPSIRAGAATCLVKPDSEIWHMKLVKHHVDGDELECVTEDSSRKKKDA